jgi:hypothetical protein
MLNGRFGAFWLRYTLSYPVEFKTPPPPPKRGYEMLIHRPVTQEKKRIGRFEFNVYPYCDMFMVNKMYRTTNLFPQDPFFRIPTDFDFDSLL